MNGITSIMSATIPFEETLNSLISVMSNIYYAGQNDTKRLGETFRLEDATVTQSVLAAMVTEPELIPYECTRSSGVLNFWDDESEDIYTFEDGSKDGISKITELTSEEWPTTVSEECKEFCNSRGLSYVLEKCLIKAKEIFSNIIKLSAELDYFRDDLTEDTAHVVIRVEVNSDQQTALREYDQWICWMAINVTPNDSEFFTLTIRRV